MNTPVLGLGNILLQDEGPGARALERLVARHPLPDQVQAMDGDTLGLDLLPCVEQATDLLVWFSSHPSLRTHRPSASISGAGETAPPYRRFCK